ncbi:MAG: metal ABC transporter permease [Phycisphaeraceae bacterium]|nr:MAG: metal ABC transporter permease [Phycisphaeraceae bacterium]
MLTARILASELADSTHSSFSASTLDTLIQVLTFRSGYNTNLVIAGTALLGFAAGIIGVFAMLRKRSLVADALSHATLPGICMAFLLAAFIGQAGRTLPVLLIGAGFTGVLGVLCIQMILRHGRLREDVAITVVLGAFFGAGVVGLSYIQAHSAAGSAGITRFIYGQAASMQPSDVVIMAWICGISLLACMLLFKEFTIVCFNDSYARTLGWPVERLDLGIMALIVLVTLVGLQTAGLILVVALLILPAASARFWTDRIRSMVLLSGLFGATGCWLGSTLSAVFPRYPTGAVIVLTSGLLFALSMLFAPRRGLIHLLRRRGRLQLHDLQAVAVHADGAPGFRGLPHRGSGSVDS